MKKITINVAISDSMFYLEHSFDTIAEKIIDIADILEVIEDLVLSEEKEEKYILAAPDDEREELRAFLMFMDKFPTRIVTVKGCVRCSITPFEVMKLITNMNDKDKDKKHFFLGDYL